MDIQAKFDLGFGGLLSPTMPQTKRTKFSSVYSFPDAASMGTALPHWSQDYTCDSMEDVHEFVKGSSVALIAKYWSCENIFMNSGLVMDSPDEESVLTEYCYDKQDYLEAGSYLCGQDDTCLFADAGPVERVTYYKDKSASMSICFDPACHSDISPTLMYGIRKIKAVKDAFLNKFTTDFLAFVDDPANVPVVAGLEAITEHNVYEFLVELSTKLQEICKKDKYLLVGAPATLAPFRLANIYHQGNTTLMMQEGVSNGYVGSALEGMFDIISIPGLPADTMYVGVPGSIKFWRNPFMYYSINPNGKCGHGRNHTWTLKYNFIKQCDTVCDLFKFTFEAATCNSYTIDGEICENPPVYVHGDPDADGTIGTAPAPAPAPTPTPAS